MGRNSGSGPMHLPFGKPGSGGWCGGWRGRQRPRDELEVPGHEGTITALSFRSAAGLAAGRHPRAGLPQASPDTASMTPWDQPHQGRTRPRLSLVQSTLRKRAGPPQRVAPSNATPSPMTAIPAPMATMAELPGEQPLDNRGRSEHDERDFGTYRAPMPAFSLCWLPCERA